jgi:hypothetical protein
MTRCPARSESLHFSPQSSQSTQREDLELFES